MQLEETPHNQMIDLFSTEGDLALKREFLSVKFEDPVYDTYPFSIVAILRPPS